MHNVSCVIIIWINKSDVGSAKNFWLYPGSARHSSRRVGGRNRKEEVVIGEGKTSRRGSGGGPSSHEASQTKVFSYYFSSVLF